MNRSTKLDTATVNHALQVLEGKSRRRGLSRMLPFLGPAFIASVAYIDPGNFATNVESGSRYGMALLWVVILASLSAYFVQILAARLGTVTGYNLAEQCRRTYPKPVVMGMWAGMELVAVATDLAEFIGATIAFHILLPVTLADAALLTALAATLVLAVQSHGFRPFEWVIAAFVGFVAVAYVIELFAAPPRWAQVESHLLNPGIPQGGLFLAVGIVGATIMPHVIFLHSSLTQKRIRVDEPRHVRTLLRYETWDIVVAMSIATLTNAAMLIMSAAAFHHPGIPLIIGLSQAYHTLTPLLGPIAATLFALALLASGISATTVGTFAGQVMMQGFINFQIPIWLRRMLTLVPSFAIVVFSGWNLTQILLWTQVLISFGLPLALVPLADFTSRRTLMGSFVNPPTIRLTAWSFTVLLAILNLILIVGMLR